MILAADPAGVVAIDPTLLALIPIVTVVLTILAGLVGAAIQGRREHAKWLRDRRLEAFITARVYVGQLEQILNELRTINAEIKSAGGGAKPAVLDRALELRAEAQDLQRRMPEVTVAFDLLGSGMIEDSINEVIRAVGTDDTERIKRAKDAFLRDARALLAIRTLWWARLRRWWRKRRVKALASDESVPE